MSVTVTPRVSERARSLPLGGVCQGLELDVALTPGVCVVRVSDSSGGRELLLLLCDNSAAFCRHSHAVVLWNEARKGRAKSDRRCHTHTHTHIYTKTHTQTKPHTLNEKHALQHTRRRMHTHICTQRLCTEMGQCTRARMNKDATTHTQTRSHSTTTTLFKHTSHFKSNVIQCCHHVLYLTAGTAGRTEQTGAQNATMSRAGVRCCPALISLLLTVHPHSGALHT